MTTSPLLEFLLSRSRGELLAWQDQLSAARRFNRSVREVELLALQHGLLPARYIRNRKTITTEGQLRLCSASVVVVGCGGLGGYVLELLARLGVGRLRAVDPDCFEEHNLNRQLLSTVENLGQAKVDAARLRIGAVNPAVELEPHQCAFSAANGAELLQGAEVAVDALDNLATRRELAKQCLQLRLPLVQGAIAGWYGQLGIQLPDDAGSGLRWIPAEGEQGGLEKELGNPSFTPAAIAALQAAEVCKLLLGEGGLPGERTLWVDLQAMEFLIP